MSNSANDVILIRYIGVTPSLAMPLPGIEPELISAQDVGGGNFDYRSTLTVSNASVLADINNIICDAGSAPTEIRQTVELRCESE